MRLLYFNDFRLGVLKGDKVVDVTTVVANIPHTGPGDLMNGLIANFANFRSRLQDAVAKGDGPSVMRVKIRPPLPKPVNVECMAVNYMEDGTKTEPAPKWRASLPACRSRAPQQTAFRRVAQVGQHAAAQRNQQ